MTLLQRVFPEGIFAPSLLVFLFAFIVMAATLPVPENPPWEPLARRAIDGTDNPLLDIYPAAFKLALPFWTQIPSSVLDFAIAFRTISFEYSKRRGNQELSPWYTVLRVSASMIYLSIQTLAGLIHLAQNARGINLVQKPGGNNFVSLFAATCMLWNKTILEHKRTLLVLGWSNVALAMIYFIVLSLPVVGSGGLYEASSPWCSSVVANGDYGQFGSTTGGIPLDCSSYGGGWVGGSCSTSDELQLGHMQTIFGPPTIVFETILSWVFVVLISALLLSSIWTEMTNPIEQGEHRNLMFAGTCGIAVQLELTDYECRASCALHERNDIDFRLAVNRVLRLDTVGKH
jgi:hypothetical protein